MKTAPRGLTTDSHPSWPFPAASHLRNTAAAPPAPAPEKEDPDRFEGIDPVEQELVEEQRERDRKASDAVDPNRRSSPER